MTGCSVALWSTPLTLVLCLSRFNWLVCFLFSSLEVTGHPVALRSNALIFGSVSFVLLHCALWGWTAYWFWRFVWAYRMDCGSSFDRWWKWRNIGFVWLCLLGWRYDDSRILGIRQDEIAWWTNICVRIGSTLDWSVDIQGCRCVLNLAWLWWKLSRMDCEMIANFVGCRWSTGGLQVARWWIEQDSCLFCFSLCFVRVMLDKDADWFWRTGRLLLLAVASRFWCAGCYYKIHWKLWLISIVWALLERYNGHFCWI